MLDQRSPATSPTVFARRILGVELHPGQSEFLEAKADIKAAACGRRFGKTTMESTDLLHFATVHPGTTQVIVAPTADQASILFDMAHEMAEQGELSPLLTNVVRSPFPELSLAGRDEEGQEVESVIMARSASHDGRYLRGHGADRVVCDEAAFIPERVVMEVVPPMLATSPYGQLVLLSTPFGLNFFYEYVKRGQRGDPAVASFVYPSHANPHLSTPYLERQRSEMTDLAYRCEYLAEFTADQTSVFSHAVIEAALDGDIDPRPRPGRTYAAGFDPAKFSDRSGLAVIDCTQKPYAVVHVEDIGGRDYLVQAARVREVARSYNNAHVLLDSTAHAQMQEELRRQGVHVEGYTFTNKSKNELIDNLVIVLEHDDLRIPADAYDLIREMQFYAFQRTAAGHVRLGAPDRADAFDDLTTALALAVWNARTAGSRMMRRPVAGPPRRDAFSPSVYSGYSGRSAAGGRSDERSMERPIEHLMRDAYREARKD